MENAVHIPPELKGLNLTEHRWHMEDVGEVERLLKTSPSGLGSVEAAERLSRFGPNEIERERETPWWQTLLHQFKDPLIYILLIAAVVTLALQDFVDTGVILVVVLINAVIGYTQERRAQKAMRALADLSAPKCEVIRDGAPIETASRNLVPGDVVVLISGSRVPADLRLFRVQDLQIDESALTGESLPAHKSTDTLDGETRVAGDQFNIAFSGTVVTRGRGWGYVARTGTSTEIGRIATAIREVGHTTTPLQEQMTRFGKQIAIGVVALSGIVALIGLFRAMPPTEILLVAIAMAVSGIPEGLPVVLTITFAVGIRRMSRRNAIIRSLPAVETLGSATVIGSDKTGTLTQNEMTVMSIWSGGDRFALTGTGYDPTGIIQKDDTPVTDIHDHPIYATLLTGILANEADTHFLSGGATIGDPTELALYTAAAKGGLAVQDLRREYVERDIVPFESEERLMATLNDGPAGRYIHMKGAPEVILDRCESMLLTSGEAPLDRDLVRRSASTLAGEGLRVLAMAFRPYSAERIDKADLGHGFILTGLQGMHDPVRPEAIDAVRDAHSAGIRVIMLTGDHVETASAVGRQLNLYGFTSSANERSSRVAFKKRVREATHAEAPPAEAASRDAQPAEALEGERLNEMTEEELSEHVKRINIFARVAPEHKLRIVNHLKAHDHIVAVTGDGVNDAPALRAAHLGVAMGKSGTDVAREASDLVLADDNFATITAAVEEGRVVFANIRKVTFFLLSTAVGEIIAIMASLILGWPLPFLAAQILWVNLVTNGLQDVALAFEPPEKNLLRRPPRSRHEGVVSRRIFERLIAVGIVLAAGTLAMFWWTLETTGDIDLARTVAVTQMVVFQFFHVFNSRSLDASITSIPLFSNRMLYISIVAAALAQVAVLHVPFLQLVFRTQPLDAEQWLLILLVGSTVILGGELDKWRNRRRASPLG